MNGLFSVCLLFRCYALRLYDTAQRLPFTLGFALLSTTLIALTEALLKLRAAERASKNIFIIYYLLVFNFGEVPLTQHKYYLITAGVCLPICKDFFKICVTGWVVIPNVTAMNRKFHKVFSNNPNSI